MSGLQEGTSKIKIFLFFLILNPRSTRILIISFCSMLKPVIFLNEDTDKLVELYLAVCEMEYFPMECIMEGTMQDDTLKVIDLQITYIEGCGE